MSKTKIPYPSSGGTYEHRDGALHRAVTAPAATAAPREAKAAAPAAPKQPAAKAPARKTTKTKR